MFFWMWRVFCKTKHETTIQYVYHTVVVTQLIMDKLLFSAYKLRVKFHRKIEIQTNQPFEDTC